jgi:tetratricopeptide (TPR) repeat protein
LSDDHVFEEPRRPQPVDKNALQRAAEAAESAGEFRRAIESRQALARSEPDSPAAQFALARALQKAGEQRAAVNAYSAALRLGAPRIDVHLQLGVLYHGLFEHEIAISHLEKVIAQEPAHADALCMLGVVLHDLGRFADAARQFERALAVRRAFPEALFNLGLSCYESGDFRAAAECFARCFALNRGAPWTPDPAAALHCDPAPAFAPRDMAVNRTKLRHDCEQLEYLLERGRLPGTYRAVLEDYRSLLREVERIPDDGRVVPFDAGRHPRVARTYKRPIYVDASAAPAGALVNPDLDFAAIEQRYMDARPSVVTIDNLLTREALQALRAFCRESTIWNHVKTGYLGAYFYDGFSSELLLRVAAELRERFPRIVRGLPLQMMWGYKCDSALPALGTHADAAAVNVNFWITEDEANLDLEHGGLLVYTNDAPREWGFAKFNIDSETIERYLESCGSVPLRVPYRSNRAVVFDSDLFHASDRPQFRDGYLNRRINVTLLYGLRAS